MGLQNTEFVSVVETAASFMVAEAATPTASNVEGGRSRRCDAWSCQNSCKVEWDTLVSNRTLAYLAHRLQIWPETFWTKSLT